MDIWELYYPAFKIISDTKGFTQLVSVYKEGSARWFNESVAHELAHQVVLGLDLSSRGMTTRIGTMTPKDADHQELWSLATELAALDELGLRVDHRKLCYWSSEMMRQKFMTVPLTVYQCAQHLIGSDLINRWKSSFLHEISEAVAASEKLQKEAIRRVEATTTFS